MKPKHAKILVVDDELDMAQSVAVILGAADYEIAIETETRRLTWSELNDRVNRLAHGLSALGLRKSDRIAVLHQGRVIIDASPREVRDNSDFDTVLEMVRSINDMGMEVCCTLGMLTESQAKKLADAGLYAYNHNLDSSEDFYKTIITTRKYDERLATIENVRKAKVTVCCGGIIGMGESVEDRIKMLYNLSNLNPQPESVPINALVPVEGTPLEKNKLVSIWEMVRMIATTRIVMSKSVVRLSAGRTQMSLEGQALCFLAGANSIFAGDKLLTTPNPDFNEDMEMFKLFGLRSKEAFKYAKEAASTEIVSA